MGIGGGGCLGSMDGHRTALVGTGWTTSHLVSTNAGADPETEEGGRGGIRIEWGIGAAHVYRGLIPRPLCALICRSQYVAQKPENEATYIEHAQSS